MFARVTSFRDVRRRGALRIEAGTEPAILIMLLPIREQKIIEGRSLMDEFLPNHDFSASRQSL
jgi:hypothetical protein